MEGSSFHSSSLSLSSSTQSSTRVPPPTSTAQYIKQQRRMTAPTSSLNPPESGHAYQQQPGRPPSPLRNGFVPDTFTGIDIDNDESDEDDNQDSSWRSPSPTSSVSQMAATFAQRMGSLVNNITPSSPRSMPTDAELEAEAERERDRSRREAERILTQEAEERRLMEEKVLAMMQNSRGSPKSLPPPPPRSQTGSNPPSPANSHKENSTSWWAAAKNKLTPTKEPLTPAQQIIMDAKAREKEKKNKGKEKEKAWPASTQTKFTDPAFLNLNIPVTPPKRRPVPASPTSSTSPTPLRPNANTSIQPLDLTPSPMRPSDAISSSPSREAPPLYAQFNAQGTLDVPGTLLIIAKRFEKLEKWTVGHVRALEERMSDVERWLVDKEREKEISMAGKGDEKKEGGNQDKDTFSNAPVEKEINEIREDITELQGRVGELGREMAKVATTPANLSSGPSRQPASVTIAPRTSSSIAVSSVPSPTPDHSSHTPPPPQITVKATPRVVSSTARESTSPPMASRQSTAAARTRLPYPTGDYAATPNEESPTNSPTSSSYASSSIAGLPPVGLGITSSSQSASTSGLPRTASPASGLPIPSKSISSVRPTSVSPPPRKRYTVALGGPITAPDEHSEPASGTPLSFSKRQPSIETAFFSPPTQDDNGDDDEIPTWKDEFEDDTIGKTTAAKITNARTNTHSPNNTSSLSPRPSPSRIRAQSAYGLSSFQNLPHTPTASTTPLKPRLRSHSTDRFGLGDAPGSRFVDPLVVRKQSEGERKVAMPAPSKGKIPIGQLVAFFDREKAAKE